VGQAPGNVGQAPEMLKAPGYVGQAPEMLKSPGNVEIPWICWVSFLNPTYGGYGGYSDRYIVYSMFVGTRHCRVPKVGRDKSMFSIAPK
ncbi:MAG: hypothetical protein ACRC62_09055, partial [Microcoleus sp.]